ncbi:phage shock protein C (PspC) family protein [Curtobacterium sp. PhB130]|uniref:PspC domain-containing protein n=1 Tax=Curtobacterium sp. PhB130 TaxID=2485178 RepID=UPI000F4BF510|nr:PspC domain-containing protein [Curtobacterium sp. PhB130]ROS74857.1 phage shock protein C (PspC) family protein [Curtobacterium sp. PhB130]
MTQQETGGPASATRFFDWIRGVHVVRSDDRWLAGVCGAVAQRTGLDPLVVRGVAIVVALLGGPVFLAYAAGWALLPDTEGRIHAERLVRGVFDPAVVAIGVLVVLTFVPAVQGIWWQGVPVAWGMPDWLSATLGTAWTIVLVGGAVWLVVVLARRGPRPPDGQDTAGAATRRDIWTSADEPSTADASDASWRWTAPATEADRSRQHQERVRAERARAAERRTERAERQPGAPFVAVSIGIALVAGAGVAVWAQQTDLPIAVLGIAAAVAVLAVATIVAGVRGRESGGLGFFSTVGVVALVVTGILPGGTQVTVIGGTTWRVDDVGQGVERNYAMLVGGPTLDLRGLDEADGGGRVTLWLGAGGAEVLLPADAPVRVHVSGVGYGVDTDTDTDTDGDGDDDLGGVLGTTTVENRAARTAAAADVTTVQVWIVGGGVDVPRAVRVDQ